MDPLFLLGRILFAGVFMTLGVGALASRRGRPAGLVLTTGGAMVALGLWADLGAILAAAAVLAVSAQRHRFWLHPPGAERQAHLTHLIKNLALIGAALILVFTYNQLGDSAPLSLTGPLF